MAVRDLDTNFKSPVVHNKIKQMFDNCQFVSNHVRNVPILREVSMEKTEDIGAIIYQTLSMLVRFSFEEVDQFNGVLRQMVADAEAREAQNV